MICPRCGALYEGNFCPNCGAPRPASAPPWPPTYPAACPRCGTPYRGNFCPRCGLPAGPAAYGPSPLPRPASGGRSALSVLWSLALVAFVVFMALNFVGLLASPPYVVPGIQGISSGYSANANLSAGSANWSFQALGSGGATGTFNPTGGTRGGALEMTLPSGSNVGGEWMQTVQLTGSSPWLAEAALNFSVSGLVAGRLFVSVENVSTGLDTGNASFSEWVNGSTGWTSLPPVDVSAGIGGPGTYFLKVAYLAATNGGTTIVRFEDVRMAWTTDAEFYFYLPLPLPELLFLVYVSQDPAQFLAYYAFIVAAIVAAGLWYTWRDRRLTIQAFAAPLGAIGTRLRSMSAWVAVAQVWMATMFFQYALILLLAAIGSPATSPFTQTPTNAWVLLFEFSAASVYEELAFRALLIGVPMAVGALVLRLAQGLRSGRRIDIVGALRYLWGGNLRRESPREALLAGWILVFASSLLFGLAHAPGWGWWKVLPAFVVGLGMGYVFVRHGLGASILLHFATDGAQALVLEGFFAASLVQDLLFLGLVVAGVGFFAWYVLYGLEELRALWSRFSSRIVRQPVGTAPGPGTPPMGYGGVGGSAGASYPVPPVPPPPPATYAPPPGYPTPTATWPSAAPAASPARSPGLVPPGYAPSYHPAPYGYPPVRFQCPFCGWVEARYENRRFTCLRCGRTA